MRFLLPTSPPCCSPSRAAGTGGGRADAGPPPPASIRARQTIQGSDRAAAHPLGTLEKPGRVGGPEGELAYLAQLRCSDGASPRIGSRENAGVDAFGSIAHAFLLTCGSGGARIIFDIYHEEHVEDRAPPGFTIQAR